MVLTKTWLAYIWLVISPLILIKPIQAQIRPDNSLGRENSSLSQDNINGVDSDIITGGATRGENLFHSFREFNVEADRGVYFANPNSISNIFTRVTGNNLSNIQGVLGVLGEANLFLINPNGIVFGPNARLDLQGSFFASTASGIVFNNFEFSTINPDSPPLLSIDIPIGLRFRNNPGVITTTDTLLTLESGKTLGLIGGNLTIENSTIQIPGGKVELGGLNQQGIVRINADFSLSFPQNGVRSNLEILNNSVIDVSPNSGTAGNVTINADSLSILNMSTINANVLSEKEGEGGIVRITNTGDIEFNQSVINVTNAGRGDAGTIIINTAGELTFSESTLIANIGSSSSFTSQGKVGRIDIQANSISLSNGSQIQAGVFSGNQGEKGLVSLQANQSLSLDNTVIFANVEENAIADSSDIRISASLLSFSNSQLNASNLGTGNAGNISLTATAGITFINTDLLANLPSFLPSGNGGNVIIEAQASPISFDNSDIYTNSSLGGIGGDINITVSSLEMNNNSDLGSFSREGNAGNIIINTLEFINLDNNSDMNFFANQGSGTGGNVTLNTIRLTIANGSDIFGAVLGEGRGGTLTINATDSVEITGSIETTPGIFSGSGLSMSTIGSGDAGNIIINTRNLLLDGGGFISTANLSEGEGTGGTIIINASESVELKGITPDNMSVSQISSDTRGKGRAGDIIINTNNLKLSDGTTISSGAILGSSGQGGNITITTQELELTGTRLGIFPTSLNTQSGGSGDAGNITILTNNLRILEGAQINASTFNQGRGGNLAITALNSVNISGTGINPMVRTQLATITGGEGKAGNINVNTPKLTLENYGQIVVNTGLNSQGDGGEINLNADFLSLNNYAQINAATQGIGKAGNISITTQQLNLDRNSNISANTGLLSQGDGGNIRINSLSQINLNQQATIRVDSEGEGNAGDIFLISDNLRLDNSGEISAATASGEGGNITLEIANLTILNNNSPISATAGGSGNGGNLTISTNFIIARNNSDITANAFAGRGGNISLTTQGLFFDSTSQITASSELGVDGVIEINTPDVDPSQGLVELPTTVVDPNQLIAQNPCQQGESSRFIITGRGGLPKNPLQILSQDTIQVEWLDPITPTSTSVEIKLLTSTTSNTIIPAQGWIVNEEGMVTLIGYDSTSQRHYYPVKSCSD